MKNKEARSKEIMALEEEQDRLAFPNAVDCWEATLTTMLEDHVIFRVGRSARIVYWVPRNLYPGDKCRNIQLLDERGFKLFYGDKFKVVSTTNGQRRVPLAPIALLAMSRYSGLCYAPEEGLIVNNMLNLWDGFGFEPAPGDWALMQAHIHEIIAGGDAAVSTYVFNWLAWAVQNPGRRAEVALVMSGGKGTGKGALGNAMIRLFGAHGTHIANRKHLVGGFNLHMARCSLLFADEAFWPGDKTGEGELKRLITEPTLNIEPKGVDLFEVRNCLHIIFAGNEPWIVPASGDERRFAVIEMSDARDHGYFDRLYDQLNDGGYEAMLYGLQHRDLGSWHPRDGVPQTNALRQQQAHSRKGIDALIEGIARDGELPCVLSYDKPNVTNTKGEAKQEGFWHYAKSTIPDLKFRTSTNMLDELIAKWGCERYKNSGKYGITFPPLGKLRQLYDVKHGMRDWDYSENWDSSSG